LEKSRESFDRSRLSAKVDVQLSLLLEGSFVDRAENVLAFGNPGSGKSHLLYAIALELVYQGRRVLFPLLSHRYERGSVMVTANFPFSERERIFKSDRKD